MAKVLGVKQLLSKNYVLVEGLSTEMRATIGDIEDAFVAIIYGHSGSGKTNFTVMLTKELSHLGVVLYNSHEEGHSKTVQTLAHRHKLQEYDKKFRFLDNEGFDELFTRLKKKHSPKIIVIDSIQYANWTIEQYKQMKETFKRKIFIFISHADGKEPKGAVAKAIKYDAPIKIRVEHKVAFSISRYGGNKPYIIDEQLARQARTAHEFKKILKAIKS
jgi:KaiC/GvpD/RAD55 family RecA-like ATPase